MPTRWENAEQSELSRNFAVPYGGNDFVLAEDFSGLAAIIPAYNESNRIGSVIEACCQVEDLDEIIIIDDGSSDGTGDKALGASNGDSRCRLIRHRINRGKGEALFTGWQAASSGTLLLLDADLINFRADHIYDLVQPVLRNQADMTIGLFKKGYWKTDLTHWLTPWLSGQRCMHAWMLEHINLRAASGYGFETALSMAARKYKWRCQQVPLLGVSHPSGEIPRNGWHGPGLKVRMYLEILRAWWIVARGPAGE